MKTSIDLTDATINIALEVDGQVYLVAMEKEKMEAIGALIKSATNHVIPARITQAELSRFLTKNLAFGEGEADA